VNSVDTLREWTLLSETKKTHYVEKSKRPLPKKSSFTLEKQLGTGAVSSVYKARIGGELRVLKKTKRVQQRISTTFINDNFSNEIKILQSIDSCSVIKLVNHFSDPDYYYTVFENTSDYLTLDVFCRWKTLPENDFRIVNGQIHSDWVNSIASQIYEAVNGLHDIHRVIHTDIKPQNIIYSNVTRTIKLIDFGTAFCEADLGEKRRFPGGTTVYSPPETINLHSVLYNWTQWSNIDLWSTMATIIELYYKCCNVEILLKNEPDLLKRFKYGQAKAKAATALRRTDILKNCRSSSHIFEGKIVGEQRVDENGWIDSYIEKIIFEIIEKRAKVKK
jgi:serine/threonine protein kinase